MKAYCLPVYRVPLGLVMIPLLKFNLTRAALNFTLHFCYGVHKIHNLPLAKKLNNSALGFQTELTKFCNVRKL